MTVTDDTRTQTLYGRFGRDAGKTFQVLEIDPLTLTGYALRLNSALRVESFEDLLADWRDKSAADDGEAPIDLIMRVLQGSDPKALHALITELLDYVLVAPDPQHPGALRPLLADKSDIREIRTLGEILMALVKLNFTGG